MRLLGAMPPSSFENAMLMQMEPSGATMKE
jgi:hypothetical protein